MTNNVCLFQVCVGVDRGFGTLMQNAPVVTGFLYWGRAGIFSTIYMIIYDLVRAPLTTQLKIKKKQGLLVFCILGCLVVGREDHVHRDQEEI